MTQRTLRPAYALSIAVAILSTLASAVGLFVPGVYRDNTWIIAAWRGTDVVTLSLAIPLLVAGMLLARRGSLRGLVLWIAMLGYTLYGWAFYLFGAAFNQLFLVYCALLALSLWALLLLLPRLDVDDVASHFRPLGRWVSVPVGYLVLTAVGLGVLWTAMSLGFVFTGVVPTPVANSGHPTGVVFALDLTLIVPTMLVSAWMLLKRRPWGFLLAGVLSVKGAVYTVALTSATLFAMRADVEGAGGELPLWISLTVLGVASAWVLLRALRQGRSRTLPE